MRIVNETVLELCRANGIPAPKPKPIAEPGFTGLRYEFRHSGSLKPEQVNGRVNALSSVATALEGEEVGKRLLDAGIEHTVRLAAQTSRADRPGRKSSKVRRSRDYFQSPRGHSISILEIRWPSRPRG